MVGSGTSVVIAKLLGHHALGFDKDPFAILLADVWCNPPDSDDLIEAGTLVLEKASVASKTVGPYPSYADPETRTFIDYWFDEDSASQLNSLAQQIKKVRPLPSRNALWCAFSRLIISKQAGASRAIDISHSRPHKVREFGASKPLDQFPGQVQRVAVSCLQVGRQSDGSARLRRGDSRRLPLPDASVDLTITSPPYINAIDYLRGHKFSLIWMGWSIRQIRQIRAASVGSEVGLRSKRINPVETRALRAGGDVSRLSSRYQAILCRYVRDMRRLLEEVSRVTATEGRLLLVIGDSTIRGVFVRNSQILVELASSVGFSLANITSRDLPPRRRYLPPPTAKSGQLDSRMRTEVVLEFTRGLR
jgi:hypothetical protein